MLSKSSMFTVVLGVVALAASLSAASITINNTGVCGLALCANGAVDPNYSFTSRADGGGSTATVEPPFVGSPSYAGTLGGLSKWILPGPNSAGAFLPTGSYDVSTTFDLTGLNPATASLSLSLAADNNVNVFLNGNFEFNLATEFGCLTSGSSSTQCFESLFGPESINSNFTSGVNTLTFEIINNDSFAGRGSPVAFRAELSGTADPIVPEPGTWALLGAGLAALGLFRRRFV